MTTPALTPRDPVVGPSKPRLLNVLGPDPITGASDDDPSGIAGNMRKHYPPWLVGGTVPLLRRVGWLATALMAAATVAMVL